MTDQQPDPSTPVIIVTPERADDEFAAAFAPAAGAADGAGSETPSEAVERPAKVMRIGSMIKQLLDEVRQAPLDRASRLRLKEIYESSVRELAGGLSPDLANELDRLALPFDSEEPSDAELRIAQAQLVGWLEGLFHGIQATLFAQQMAARAQLEEMRRNSLPAGVQPDQTAARPGPYL
ncbi:MAG TPA: bacterial proteasome activator family protein [Acidimicrobiales bacterium]|nr:bacterial proteasome activator family protein [Acidimicrobiales bacterium]